MLLAISTAMALFPKLGLEAKIIKSDFCKPAKILSKLKTKRGDVFLEKVVNEDVKRLYLMGFFRDVTVSLEDVQDGVGVVFVVTEKPPLTAIKFTGNRLYKEKS